MSIPTVPYEFFSNSDQAIVGSGGPWIITSDELRLARCKSETEAWCGGYCLSCQVYPGNPAPVYYPTFVTNISVNLADYGGATSLDFTWNYWPLYCGANTTAGTNVPITAQIGDVPFNDSFPSVDYTTFFNSSTTGAHQWENASQLSHNGSTSVVRGSDPNRGYIAINITATMRYTPENEQEFLNFYVKGIKFLITTPIRSASTSSSSSAQQAVGSSVPSSSAAPPAGAVAGAVIGALALVALFILAICLLRRRHKKKKNSVAVDNAAIFTQPTSYGTPTPLGEGPVPPPHLPMRYSASVYPASFVIPSSYGPPPTYGPEGYTGQDTSRVTSFSPELARFAAANRDTINENLEARLQAAGYLPTEDPSRVTAEEWRDEYGVSKLELRRLQTLYARAQQDQPR